MDTRIMRISGKAGNWKVIFRGKKYFLADTYENDALADVCMTEGLDILGLIFSSENETWTANGSYL